MEKQVGMQRARQVGKRAGRVQGVCEGKGWA